MLKAVKNLRRRQTWITPCKCGITQGWQILFTSQPRSGLNYYVVPEVYRYRSTRSCAALALGYPCVSPSDLLCAKNQYSKE